MLNKIVSNFVKILLQAQLIAQGIWFRPVLTTNLNRACEISYRKKFFAVSKIFAVTRHKDIHDINNYLKKN